MTAAGVCLELNRDATFLTLHELVVRRIGAGGCGSAYLSGPEPQRSNLWPAVLVGLLRRTPPGAALCLAHVRRFTCAS